MKINISIIVVVATFIYSAPFASSAVASYVSPELCTWTTNTSKIIKWCKRDVTLSNGSHLGWYHCIVGFDDSIHDSCSNCAYDTSFYSYMSDNSCGGLHCNNLGSPVDYVRYTCHYIDKYNDWTSCIGGVSVGTNPHWTTIQGTSCNDVPNVKVCSISDPNTNPTAVIEKPTTSPTNYTYGDDITFQGRGDLGTGGGSLDYYLWLDTNPGTPSYNGTDCSTADGTVIDSGTTFTSNRTSFTTNSLSPGTHRICFNVRQHYSDNSYLWAGSAGNVEYRDVVITPAPLTVTITSNPASPADISSVIRFTATASGGVPPYLNWTWSGDVNGSGTLYGTTQNYIDKSFSSLGTHSVNVSVQDNNRQTATATYNIQIQDNRIPQ